MPKKFVPININLYEYVYMYIWKASFFTLGSCRLLEKKIDILNFVQQVLNFSPELSNKSLCKYVRTFIAG